MTHILHRQIGGTLPVAASGNGIEIVDATGKRYLDAAAAGGDRKRAGDLAVKDVGHVIAGSAALQCRSCGVG